MIKEEIKFHFANPIMVVSDAKTAAQFYEDTPWFTIDVLCENPCYACVSRDGIIIELGASRPDYVGGCACIVHVSNIESLYNEFKAKGVVLVGDITGQEYGSKDFRIRDNDGNLLAFGSAMATQQELLGTGNVA